MSALKSIKQKEGKSIQEFTPRKKNEADGNNFNHRKGIEQPNNGREFFFSNILVKIYQVPVLFLANSEDEYSEYESSFIVLFYEKNMRKRTFAKSQTQKQRIQRLQEVKHILKNVKQNFFGGTQPRVLEDLLPNRDSKMRRFCNYFLTLFNQKKLNPFTQFVHS